jgi:hypothetical protein
MLTMFLGESTSKGRIMKRLEGSERVDRDVRGDLVEFVELFLLAPELFNIIKPTT